MTTTARQVPADLLVHLRRARDHADRHYAQSLDLDQLASVAGLSTFHFQRMFTAAYGVSPAAHLSQRRDDLRSKGVRFIQPPQERPYGVEAVARDNSGNWMELVEPAPTTRARSFGDRGITTGFDGSKPAVIPRSTWNHPPAMAPRMM